MSSIPNKGSEESNKGRMAQCIAQASEAVMPNKSQLNLLFMAAKISPLAV